MVSEIISSGPFRGYAESRIGGRSENQDTFGYADTPLGLLAIVCDGMGGGPGGKTASLTAVQTIIQTIQSCDSSISRREAFIKATETANNALVQKMIEEPSLKGMGTTLVAVLLNEESAVIAHVGDSRCYKIRGKHCVFRTQDHSMVGEMVRNKQLTEEQARLSGQSNVITRALGANQTNVTLDIDIIAYEKGDRFVLCSDGIWGMLPEPELIKRFGLSRSVPCVVERIAEEVDSLGNGNGKHHDNLTLAIVQTNKDSKTNDTMTRKAKRILLAVIAILIISCVFNIYQCTDTSITEEVQAQIDDLQQQVQMKSVEIDSLKERSQKEKEAAQATIFGQQQATEIQLEEQTKAFAEKEEAYKKQIDSLKKITEKKVVAKASNSIASSTVQSKNSKGQKATKQGKDTTKSKKNRGSK